MSMRYETTALAVANHFIELRQSPEYDGQPIDNLRLNKLVYISYGVVYGYTRKRLYGDRIEAWEYGPVIPSVYHAFKHNGHTPIDKGVEVPGSQEDTLADGLEQVRSTLRQVMGAYKGVDAFRLVAYTHVYRSPWWDALQEKGAWAKGVEIKKDRIEKYYANFMDGALQPKR